MSVKIRIIISFLAILPFIGWSQNKAPLLRTGEVLMQAIYYEGDTIAHAKLPVVVCHAGRVFKTSKQKASWDRLKYNVKKVYPYAILASAKLKEYDKILATIPNENDRKAYMKLAEKQLKSQFGDELKNLTINQGRILIKLIDRETGKTTYDVIKSMRGSFEAAMWQGLAIVFNSSLKADYDAEGEEKNIELAIRLIEDGQF